MSQDNNPTKEKPNKRVISLVQEKEDRMFDLTLRPRSLSEFIGQKKIKENLKIFIEAAKKRKESLEHVLFHGSPGIGKTTLAHIIARELKVGIKTIAGPALEKTGDLCSILTNLEENNVLFIDEMHRMNRVLEEILYPAMEEYCLDIIIGQGPSARTLRLDLPKFTLIGATTRIGMLSSPLRNRFGNTFRLDFYKDEDIKKIILRSAEILKINIEDQAAEEIAKRSRKTPRVANRLLKRVRDYSQVKADGILL
jgi:Holliday junction DNA helicase RuvB